jgi:hypothetical protein
MSKAQQGQSRGGKSTIQKSQCFKIAVFVTRRVETLIHPSDEQRFLQRCLQSDNFWTILDNLTVSQASKNRIFVAPCEKTLF